jgi:hypothetical protein
MQVPKLKVLVEAGAVRQVEVTCATDAAGWVVWIAYATRHGERREALDRQRGWARVFATLDAELTKPNIMILGLIY